MTFTQFLYRLARLARDMNAVQRGPTAISKRIVRKQLWKGAAREIGRVMR